MATSIFQILSDFFSRYGLWVVFFGVLFENFGVPVPGETVLLFAGFLAYQGRVRIGSAILAAIVGATLGGCGGFALGWYGGTPFVTRYVRRFPAIAKHYDEAQHKFLKYGHWAVFTARFITGLRVFAGLLAGALRMSFSTFLIFSFAGAACWGIVIGYVGYVFGSSWDKLVGIVGRMDRIAFALVGGCAVVFVLIYAFRRKNPA